MAGFLIRPLSRVPFLFIIGRMYGDAAFGRLVFAVGLFEAAAALSRLGLRDNLFRFLAENPDDPQGVISDCLALAAGLAALVALTLVVAIPFVPTGLGAGELWAALRTLAPLLPVFVLTDVLLAASRAQRSVGYEVAARSLVEPAVLTLGAAGLGLLGHKSGLLEAYAVAQACSFSVAVFGVSRRYPWRQFRRPRWSRVRHYAAVSAPTGLADCMNIAFLATGTATVGQFSGAAAVGIYGMALNLETALSKIRQAFDMIVLPIVGQRPEGREAELVGQLREVGRWILNAQLPLLMIFLLVGDLVLGLFGKDFAAGGIVLTWLALAAVIDGTLNLAQVPLYLRKPRINSAIAMLGLVLHVSLSSLLVPRLGAVGAAISMATSVSVAGFLRQCGARRLLGRWLVDWTMLKPLVAAAAGYAAAKLIAPGEAPAVSARLLSLAGFLGVYGITVVAVDADLRRRLKAMAQARFSRG